MTLNKFIKKLQEIEKLDNKLSNLPVKILVNDNNITMFKKPIIKLEVLSYLPEPYFDIENLNNINKELIVSLIICEK